MAGRPAPAGADARLPAAVFGLLGAVDYSRLHEATRLHEVTQAAQPAAAPLPAHGATARARHMAQMLTDSSRPPAPAPTPDPEIAVPASVPLIDVERPPTVEAAATQSAAPAVTQAIEFTMALWRIGPALIIAAEPPGTRWPALAELLGKITAAAGIGAAAGPFERVDWPLTGPGNADLQAAREWLGAFVEGRSRAKPFEHLWAMGALAQRCLTVGDGMPAQQAAPVPAVAAYRMVALPGLAEMHADTAVDRDAMAAAKSRCWTTLRALYAVGR